MLDLFWNEGRCEGVKLSRSEVVGLEGFGVVPGCLSGFVVVDWTVDHGFEWLVIFIMDYNIIDFGSQVLNLIGLERWCVSCAHGSVM